MNTTVKTALCAGTAFSLALIPASAQKKTDPVPTERAQNKVSEQKNPNIVYILIDDMGFSDLGCYGSEIRTPNIDKLAQNGLRYSNFHVTAMSSPTRAALLTGRNPHSVGMSRLANYSLDVPHAMAQVTEKAAMTPKILRDAGYGTFAVGKWHLAPGWELSPSSPVHNWPIAKGFERFYGFMDGETDQFYPELVQDNQYINTDFSDDYHLTEDLTEKALSYIKNSKATDPDKPFMLYYATGAQHSPHQPPKEYAERYNGVYETGWDVIRQNRFETQKKLGIIPQNALLAPLNEGVVPWNSLDSDVRNLFVEYQKAFAGFLEHTDEQIGQLVAALEEMGELDNTLIFLLADNGPSSSGKETGVLNSVNIKNGIPSDLSRDVNFTSTFHENAAPNYPRGWAQTSATPFSYYKEYANYLGGIRVPLIVHYPQAIPQQERGEVRDTFSFVTDIAKTVLDVTGLTSPKTVGGVKQLPLHGYSLASTWNNAQAETGRTTQFFELYGQRSLYHDGWFLSSRHKKGSDYKDDTWALYNLETDFSQQNDIAAQNPQKVKELVRLWEKEAKKYGALPLDDRVHVELIAKVLMDEIAGYEPTTILYPDTAAININRAAYPTALNRSHTITAFIDRKSADEEGALLALGNSFGGYSLYIMDNKLCYEYSYDRTPYAVRSSVSVPVGNAVEVGVRYTQTGKTSGTATLLLNGSEVGILELPRVYPFIPSSTDGMSVGRDAQDAVSASYKDRGAFKYGGDLKKVVIESEDDYLRIAQ